MNNMPLFKKKYIAVAVLHALAANSSFAATVTVDNSGDAGVGCTLREAVLTISAIGNSGGCIASGAFGSNDTINFSPSITSVSGLSSQMQITQDTSINPGGPPISINSLGNGRVFNIIFSTVSIDNLTISGGSIGDSDTNPNFKEGGGGIGISNATVTLTNSNITGNTADDDGGGIFVANSSNLTLIDSTVSGNTAGDTGGGIFSIARTTSVSIINSTISNNRVLGTGLNNLGTGHGGGVFNQGGTVSLTNTVITGNSVKNEGGGVYSTVGLLSLAGSTVSNNSAGYRGGGIAARNGSNGLSISSRSVISNNDAKGNGGGIYSTGDISLSDSRIIDNISRINADRSRSGIGGGIHSAGSASSLLITDSDISGNSAERMGGGIFAQGGDIAISDTSISSNSATNSAGGFVVLARNTGTFNNVSVLDNTAGSRAGGVYIRGISDFSINDSTISGNSSGEEGGGINLRYNDVSLQLNRTKVIGNSATKGAGIYTNGFNTLSLSNSTVADNVSRVSAGGIETGPITVLSVADSTVSGNIAGTYGGGLNIGFRSDATIVNSTISGNSAGTFGGGVNAAGLTNVSVVNSTLSGNSALDNGGNARSMGTSFSFSNSLIDGGSAPVGSAIADFSGTLSFSGFNLLGDNSVTSAQAFNFPLAAPAEVVLATSDGMRPTDVSNILLPLSNNGGPTLTHGLPKDSPAIDAADDAVCAAAPVNHLDQRGEQRPAGSRCDIGAYEGTIVDESTFFVIPLPSGKSVIFDL